MKQTGLVTMGILLALGGCAGAESGSASEESTAGAERPTHTGDLGIPNETHPETGLTVGGQPSDAALNAAEEEGFQTVISLRLEGEPGEAGEATAVRERGMEFIRIPVAGSGGLTEENARALGEVLDDPSRRPILLHCGTGNRSGALLALKAFYVDGASVEEAMEIGREAGMTGLADATREKLEAAAAERSSGGE